ncbi:right-handed parallel beta-helix repeat-containing protein [Sphingomonas sp. 7/4-4]|uniref:right-handed parallel beta-helix repeat-containing protein n=1 Tax=Sphingomonas sp. 7/4-4 TaxID=3018446 RepID=UPI0022F3EC1B|nr:right-handed parallel beta-helix repeat-containing protein [Sphingomonas sp. 7/4-4]WBY06815.1 right-handed parallel beta-helix repeat-containing protein [Sphingomonas sp. 7/4-4]
MLMGNATFTGSVPSVVNGQAIFLEWCNKCEITGVEVSGFSDGGIFFFNGNDNLIANCYVRFVSQGLGFLAGNADCRGNVADGNRITDIRHYNGLHAEGGFGGGANSGKLFGTVFVGNTIARCRENGINIELAPEPPASAIRQRAQAKRSHRSTRPLRCSAHLAARSPAMSS